MALTVNIRERFEFNNFYARLVEVTFDSSYPTGGEALTDTQCGLNDDNLYVGQFSGGLVNVSYDRTNQKLLAYWGDYNNASDGVFEEVDDTSNLSAATVLLLAIGKKPA